MEKYTLVALALALCLNASAIVPEGETSREEAMKTLSVRPGTAEGKILTMEEAILSREVYPQRSWASWIDNDRFKFYRDKIWYESSVTSDIEKEHAMSISLNADLVTRALPKGAASITRSTDGESIAFTIDQSLYYIDSLRHVYPVALSENGNITYGQTVSRNEFGINGGIFWSPDSRKIAFYRKDETLVTDFPLLDITTRTGSLRNIKYPMNGMSSENVRLGIYSITANTTVYLEVDDFGYDQYLTNITWSPDSRHIFIQVLDRAQKNMRLNMYSASDGSFEKTILTEHDDRYVEPLDPLHWLSGTDKFIYRTEARDGYRNLYLCDTTGNVLRLTDVAADVQFIAENGKSVFYSSAEVSPAENHIFRIDLSINRKGVVK